LDWAIILNEQPLVLRSYFKIKVIESFLFTLELKQFMAKLVTKRSLKFLKLLMLSIVL